jgi:arylsulfatase A-like enzyme
VYTSHAESVHCPIEAPESYVAPYAHLDPNRQRFAGMLAALDEAVELVVSAFAKHEMWEDTLTIFSTVR